MENCNLLSRTKKFFRLYKIFPKKRLGQNFTINIEVLQKLVSYACLTKNDVVLEVGAGFGFLTKLLSNKCKKVISVEIDHQLVNILREQLSDLKNVELIGGDILKIAIPSFNKVVSAPPYSISSPFLFRLLETKFDSAVFLLQNEFSERLAASVGTKDYGRLTVMVYYWADVELLDYVSRSMFYPPPEIDSRIVRLKYRYPYFKVDNETFFFRLVRALFSQRNKKIRNSLIPFLQKHKIPKGDSIKIADSIVFSSKRVWELKPEDFGVLTNELLTMF